MKGASAASKELNKEEFKLDKEELESFLLNYSGKLIKGTVDYVGDIYQTAEHYWLVLFHLLRENPLRVPD